jgi:hypothetical protein
MRRVFLCLVVLFFLTFVFPVFGQNTIAPFVIPSARFSGLGGNHVAVGDSFHALFTNPATFVDIERQFSAAELTISTYGPIFEIMDLVGSGTDNLDLSGIVGPNGFAAGFDMAGPISLGWVGNGLGFGIFNRLKTDAILSGTFIKPVISGEILLVGGYSFRLINKDNHLLDLGFLGKGFFRGDINLETSIFDAMSFLDNMFDDRPFKSGLGAGIDLGLRYTFRNNFAVSLVCFDVYSPVLITEYGSFTDFTNLVDKSKTHTYYATVKRRLDFGVKYTIQNSFLDRYVSDLTIMADYRDILDLFSLIPRNPILNIGIGIELRMLNVLSVRFGLADALPAFGLGLDLTFMTMDVAIHGKELGIDPGRNSTYGLSIGFLFHY